MLNIKERGVLSILQLCSFKQGSLYAPGLANLPLRQLRLFSGCFKVITFALSLSLRLFL
jgi:hypothetical protein